MTQFVPMIGIVAASVVGSLTLVYLFANGLVAYDYYLRHKDYVEVTDETDRRAILDAHVIKDWAGENPRVFVNTKTGASKISRGP
jgi:hypothetical protein